MNHVLPSSHALYTPKQRTAKPVLTRQRELLQLVDIRSARRGAPPFPQLNPLSTPFSFQPSTSSLSPSSSPLLRPPSLFLSKMHRAALRLASRAKLSSSSPSLARGQFDSPHLSIPLRASKEGRELTLPFWLILFVARTLFLCEEGCSRQVHFPCYVSYDDGGRDCSVGEEGRRVVRAWGCHL